ncbi:hypothetical protein [Listeria booriae]|uniref:hypothetical protein n=1 Tax=Listeria booriae TaxID=1552123 RepID=UPI00162343AB|nr:hypothetical protein [Listeria booriae]MBC1513676.1 hypothetical protein [Listeria booriae]MBC6152612.1 hypothetical protein [Listeria booriae]MBC6306478.1 hypothetical protein [Listeria booriae]
MIFKNKKWLALAVVALSLICIFTLLFIYKSTPEKLASEETQKKTDLTNPIFMRGNGYLSLNKDEVFSISIPYIFNEQNITNVESVVSDNDQALLEFSDTSGDYVFDENTNVNSFNFDISFKSVGQYVIDKVTIVTSEKTVVVDIGHFIFDITDSSDSDLALFGDTIGIQSSLDNYLLSIKNENKKETLKITSIYAKTDALSLESKEFELAPDGLFSGELSTSISADNPKYSWYVIKPKIEYSVKNTKQFFLSNATYLGLVDISQHQVDIALKNKRGSEFK